MSGYQLKITIKDSQPPIWRRVIVPQHITFFDLDDIIEAMFGWIHEHMFAFNFKYMNAEFIGTPIKRDEDSANECIDEWMRVGRSFLYTYDFGDNWQHTVKVEKIVEYDERYPQVVDSKGPNMIEDCGGLWGFYEVFDEAEPFDMEEVNEKFEDWELPEVHTKHTPIQNFQTRDNWIEEWNSLVDNIFEDGLDPIIRKLRIHEDILRKQTVVVESLEDVFNQYVKDELKMIAKLHGFKGYSKLKKKELAYCLKNHLLETEYMKKVLKEASEDEITLFENAIEEQGIMIMNELRENSLLLITYGEYIEEYGFYQIPVDVQEKYKEICTPEFREELKKRHDFFKYCDAAVYLYGVFSIDKFIQIYNSYEHTDMTKRQVKNRISEYIAKGTPYIIQDGLVMDEELAEENLYEVVLKAQEEYTYYIPKDKDEFLKYGIYECQEPDENTDFFVKYLQKKYRKQEPEALTIFYMIQDGIRMNVSDEELIGELMELGCNISSQKKMREMIDCIRKMRKYTRVWDLKGHSQQEIQNEIKQKNIVLSGNKSNIIPFPLNKKVYPNDLCPCGSGKKYKHCCGKKKEK